MHPRITPVGGARRLRRFSIRAPLTKRFGLSAQELMKRRKTPRPTNALALIGPCQHMAFAHNPSMNRASLSALLFAAFLASFEGSAAPSAEDVISKAKGQAAKEGKKVFLTFDASW